jgi:hypothetical protein
MIGSFASSAEAVTDFFSKPVELFKADPGQEMLNQPEPLLIPADVVIVILGQPLVYH